MFSNYINLITFFFFSSINEAILELKKYIKTYSDHQKKTCEDTDTIYSSKT